MKAPAEAAGPAAWNAQRELGADASLRLWRWVALTAGRRLTRLFLHPTIVYYMLRRPEVRAHSARYLERALGRRARWGDIHRHLHTFAATMLDRVFLLRERFDLFTIRASGIDAILEPFGRGEGVLAFGAHLGSFEALRMIGHDKGLRVAMIMYEDNARMLNRTLAAIAPQAALHTIALGRVDAMLELRRWLEGGGVAGVLADRTLPGQSQRSKTFAIPFLGAPAPFSDGPFRLAAMLRRKVIFMAGLYRGGNEYDLRFTELADFSTLAGNGADRDAAIRAAIERYAATLEGLCRELPYNWFNFFDFWAGADAATGADDER